MNKPLWKGLCRQALTLVLALCVLPLSARAEQTSPVSLTADHVTLEGERFPYTGSYITPQVTVTVEEQTLIQDTHYTLSYHSNLGAGTATASVTGIEEAGYTGQVNLDFTITPDDPDAGDRGTALTGEHITLEGTSFPYTGKTVTPGVTVTVAEKTLTLGTDYSLTYENNLNPGTASITVRGLGDYTGEVKLTYTIEEPEQTPETTPESVTYKITKGDKSTWYKKSAKSLSFTSDGKFSDFQGVQIDGKRLDSKYYTAKSGSTIVTLKSAYLQNLDTGRHTITLVFADGQAEGAFKVSAAVDSTNYPTADSFRPELWLGLMGLSLAGGCILFALRKKFR